MAKSIDTNSKDQTTKMPANASNVEKISYALGYEVAQQTPPELDMNSFIKGVREGHAQEKPAYTEEELQKAFEEFQQEIQKQQETISKEDEAKVKKAQKANTEFLKENAKKPSVKITASGLQYTVTKEGTGKTPKANSTVKVHYIGKLVDGTVFDSSIERGEPIEFPLDQVISGWTEGLQLMQEGGKATFVIPAELAYGKQGILGSIPPNSPLIFDVELLQVK
ncbi:FKBP-type peptidyl-prolyl cis-trans isomerase [Acinetobacter equi]|uniref:FKBP-type peptidyl-prolyl cis-trans isomerase n=1 Tax=Acinetobacter equi TaxID=1324350 RepID=UPI003AA80479